jgi:hypothetical protein
MLMCDEDPSCRYTIISGPYHTVTLSGVGFAPSPFLKCALAQTDPNRGLGGVQAQAAAPAKGDYRNYYAGGTTGHLRRLTAGAYTRTLFGST